MSQPRPLVLIAAIYTRINGVTRTQVILTTPKEATP